jgi:putative endonuclease
MGNTKEIGNLGEDIAVDFLQKKGLDIIERNWHFGHLEIDIIGLHNKTLVFVEVKTRNSNFVVEPELSLTKKQQGFLVKAANAFIDTHNYDLEARFDIVSVVTHPEGNEVYHIEEAFFPYQK